MVADGTCSEAVSEKVKGKQEDSPVRSPILPRFILAGFKKCGTTIPSSGTTMTSWYQEGGHFRSSFSLEGRPSSERSGDSNHHFSSYKHFETH